MKVLFNRILFSLLCFGVVGMLSPIKAMGFTGLDDNSITERFKPKYELGTGFGIRNAGLFAGVGLQFFERVTLGGTIGMQSYNYRLQSSSDLHEIRMLYLPYMAKASVTVFKRDNFNVFLYGRYGQVWKIDRRDVTHDRSYQTSNWEVGIGAELYSKVPIQFFIGQTYTSGQGNLESTYNSSIDFEIEIYNVFAGVSISLFSN